MENILQAEIDALIERNNKLIEEKKKILNSIENKLEKGRIIFGNNLIVDTTVDVEDNRLVIKILVHPNFHINHSDTDGIPGFDYGAALDMYVFPIERLSEIETISIEEYYLERKEPLINLYAKLLNNLDEKITAASDNIKKMEADIEERKKHLENLKEKYNKKEELIAENTEHYLDKVKEITDSKTIDDSESYIKNTWTFFNGNKGSSSRYVYRCGFEKDS